jgi:hypothetical protein
MYNMNLFGYNISLEILILIGVIYLIMAGHTLCGCCRGGFSGIIESMVSERREERVNGRKEGFAGASTNNGESSSYTLGDYSSVDTSSWGMPTLVVTPGKPLSKGVQSILNREKQPVPLPEGELLMFANTPFKPECCPNTYSNSSGCACMTTAQYNDLILRGGNNVPYSEY